LDNTMSPAAFRLDLLDSPLLPVLVCFLVVSSSLVVPRPGINKFFQCSTYPPSLSFFPGLSFSPLWSPSGFSRISFFLLERLFSSLQPPFASESYSAAAPALFLRSFVTTSFFPLWAPPGARISIHLRSPPPIFFLVLSPSLAREPLYLLLFSFLANFLFPPSVDVSLLTFFFFDLVTCVSSSHPSSSPSYHLSPRLGYPLWGCFSPSTCVFSPFAPFFTLLFTTDFRTLRPLSLFAAVLFFSLFTSFSSFPVLPL